MKDSRFDERFNQRDLVLPVVSLLGGLVLAAAAFLSAGLVEHRWTWLLIAGACLGLACAFYALLTSRGATSRRAHLDGYIQSSLNDDALRSQILKWSNDRD